MFPRPLLTQLSYSGLLYLVFMGMTALLYPLSQQVFSPWLAPVLPVYQDNSLLKTLLLFTVIYWATMGCLILIRSKPPEA